MPRRLLRKDTSVMRLLALALLPACSWSLVTRAPEQPTIDAVVHCTESRVAPLADLAIAALGVAMLVDVGFLGCDDAQCGLAYPFGFAYAGLGGASAVSGFEWTSECRRVHGVQRRWLAAPRDPNLGQRGFACLPRVGGDGVCAPGSVCTDGVCLAPE
jgi:hypothetical protein